MCFRDDRMIRGISYIGRNDRTGGDASRFGGGNVRGPRRRSQGPARVGLGIPGPIGNNPDPYRRGPFGPPDPYRRGPFGPPDPYRRGPFEQFSRIGRR